MTLAVSKPGFCSSVKLISSIQINNLQFSIYSIIVSYNIVVSVNFSLVVILSRKFLPRGLPFHTIFVFGFSSMVIGYDSDSGPDSDSGLCYFV